MTAAVAILWACVCVAVAAVHYRRVRGCGIDGLDRLVRGSQTLGLEQLVSRAEELPANNPDAVRLRSALALGERSRVVAELNELLTDVGGTIGRMETVPGAAARVALFGGFLLAVLDVAFRLQGSGSTDGVTLLITLGASAVGAFVCSLIGRAASRLAAEQRALWNRLSRAAGR